mmetsp:Transcript_32559/g.76701  ORF Transcript_32559/g.76701 Transcript_32559/m.76701 type:complete len:355 (+) Transcript_32559:629-1693(+)
MHGVEAARLVVSTKNYEFLSSHCGCRMVRTWFWGRSNNVGCCPYPASHVQYTNSVEPLGTTDTTKQNQLVRRREECRRVAATTRWNVPRCGRRVPKHDFRVENAESIAGDNLFLFGSFPFDRINGFSPKGNNLLPAGDVGSGMPLPSLSSAVDGFVPRTSILGIINVHIRQDDRIALSIKGLSSVHQNLAIRHFRHGVSPSRGGCGIGKRAGSGRTRTCTGCCNHIYSNGGNVLHGILVVRVTVCHVGIGVGIGISIGTLVVVARVLGNCSDVAGAAVVLLQTAGAAFYVRRGQHCQDFLFCVVVLFRALDNVQILRFVAPIWRNRRLGVIKVVFWKLFAGRFRIDFVRRLASQ